MDGRLDFEALEVGNGAQFWCRERSAEPNTIAGQVAMNLTDRFSVRANGYFWCHSLVAEGIMVRCYEEYIICDLSFGMRLWIEDRCSDLQILNVQFSLNHS